MASVSVISQTTCGHSRTEDFTLELSMSEVSRHIPELDGTKALFYAWIRIAANNYTTIVNLFSVDAVETPPPPADSPIAARVHERFCFQSNFE